MENMTKTASENFCQNVATCTNLAVLKRTKELLQKRIDEREAVIDAVVKCLGLTDNGRAHYGLYEPTEEGTILHVL